MSFSDSIYYNAIGGNDIYTISPNGIEKQFKILFNGQYQDPTDVLFKRDNSVLLSEVHNIGRWMLIYFENKGVPGVGLYDHVNQQYCFGLIDRVMNDVSKIAWQPYIGVNRTKRELISVLSPTDSEMYTSVSNYKTAILFSHVSK